MSDRWHHSLTIKKKNVYFSKISMSITLYRWSIHPWRLCFEHHCVFSAWLFIFHLVLFPLFAFKYICAVPEKKWRITHLSFSFDCLSLAFPVTVRSRPCEPFSLLSSTCRTFSAHNFTSRGRGGTVAAPMSEIKMRFRCHSGKLQCASPEYELHPLQLFNCIPTFDPKQEMCEMTWKVLLNCFWGRNFLEKWKFNPIVSETATEHSRKQIQKVYYSEFADASWYAWFLSPTFCWSVLSP